jgi:adenylate cyclase
MADAYLIPDAAPLQRHRLGALTSMGRHPENTIEVPDRSVSKFHAQIQRTPEGRYLVQDLGSRNGTYVAGDRVERRELQDGEELILGTVRFRFRGERSGSSLTTALKVPDLMQALGGVTVLGPRTGASKGAVALTAVDPAIEHSNAFDVRSDRFLPADQVRDNDALRRDYDKLRIAHELNASLRLDAPLDELLRTIATRIFDLLPADRCAILLMDEAGKALEPRVVMQRGGGEFEGTMPLSQTVLSEVLRNRKAVLSTDAITDGRFNAAQSIVALSMRSTMCVPVIWEDEIFGAIHVDSLERSNAFAPKDLPLFTSIANQAALALKNASLIQKLQRETETRARLGRLLSPNVVEEVVSGRIDMTQGGERRQVAVMFTDIRGFTSMSERMDAADVTSMLNEYFEVMVDEIFQEGGTLDKYLGDGIMAIFGAPKEDPDAANHAVRCGLQMQAALRSLNRTRAARGDGPLHIGVGINFGEVIWGPLGSRRTMAYTVVGDTVNLASRLCGQALPGQVIVSRTVRERLANHLIIRELPPAMVKGKAEPVQVYSVEAPGAEPTVGL